MAQATATFETGTNGNTIATGDAGSANAFDAVNITAPATITYDTTHVYQTLAAKIVTGANGFADVQWSSGTLGALTDAYGRFYIYLPANIGTNATIILFRSSGTVRCRMGLNTAGKLEVRDSSNTVQATSTNAVALNQWCRVEFHVTFSATVGFMEIKLFLSPDSATATETLTSASNLNFGGASANELRIGIITAQNPTKTLWYDNIVWGAASYPGPLNVTTNLALTATQAQTATAVKQVSKILVP